MKPQGIRIIQSNYFSCAYLRRDNLWSGSGQIPMMVDHVFSIAYKQHEKWGGVFHNTPKKKIYQFFGII